MQAMSLASQTLTRRRSAKLPTKCTKVCCHASFACVPSRFTCLLCAACFSAYMSSAHLFVCTLSGCSGFVAVCFSSALFRHLPTVVHCTRSFHVLRDVVACWAVATCACLHLCAFSVFLQLYGAAVAHLVSPEVTLRIPDSRLQNSRPAELAFWPFCFFCVGLRSGCILSALRA